MDKYSRREFLKYLGIGTLSTFIPSHIASGKTENLTKMSITYPPVISSLPLKHGVDNGIFEKFGLDLRIQNVPGKKEALEPLIKGSNHCCITDISRSLMFFDRIGKNISITSTVYRPPRGLRHLGLLQSGLQEKTDSLSSFAEKLKNSDKNSIQLMIGSDVHYLTDTLFSKFDIITDENSFYSNRSSLPQTIQYLWSGKIFSAVLAEPLLTLVLEIPYFTKPLVISDYSDVRSLPSIFVFRKGVLNSNKEMVAKFYRGWMESVNETNKLSKERLFSLALTVAENIPGFKGKLENISIPPEFEQSFNKPKFENPEALENEDYSRVADWALTKGYIGKIPEYSSLVNLEVLNSLKTKKTKK